MRQRELEVLGNKLLHVRSAQVRSLLDLGNLQNVNRPESSPVPRGHIRVQRIDGIGPRSLPILFVHVVRSRSRIVANPNSKVLHFLWALLVNLVDGDNLAVGLLNLAELCKEIPEAGLGNNIVGSENTHTIEFWSRLGLGGEVAADDLVFPETTHLDFGGLRKE